MVLDRRGTGTNYSEKKKEKEWQGPQDVLRASPTGEPSREPKANFLNFSCFCSILRLQGERQPERQNAFFATEEAFLQIENAKPK